jgi:hypothetical protein
MNALEILISRINLKFDLYDIGEKTRVAVAWWLVDAMGGADLHDLSWWKVLDEWRTGATEWKRDAADNFLNKFLTVLEEQIVSSITAPNKAVAMRQRINSFNYQTRFQAAGYYDFIQSLQHTIWVQVPVICFIGGHASGDMFGIGASALIKKDMGIVVYEFKEKAQDHSPQMKGFFDLVASNRVKLAASFTDCFAPQNPNSVYKLMESMRCFCWLAGYNMGTYFLMDKFSTREDEGRNRSIVRAGFGVDKTPLVQIKTFLESKTLPLTTLRQRKVVVLWSRFTGKKGEYHAEHDTSFTGIAQLAWLATELGCYVIIAGDKPIIHLKTKDAAKRAGHFDAICQAIAVRFGEKRCFNMAQFWDDPEWKKLTPNRLTQYQVYELLHRECDVRHLGMRSGNMEALALLSYFARYMEEGYSWGGKRMMAWHGKGIGYERILLKEPPTRVGKFLHYNQKLNKHGLNKATVSQPFVPTYIRDRNRGLQNTASKNLETIEQEFARKRSEIKQRFARAPESKMKSAFDNLDPERAKREKELEEAMEKPVSVKHWYAGFDFDDLMKIVLYFREQNPCCSTKIPFNIEDIWDAGPNLPNIAEQLGEQATILFEMRSLLVEMGVVKAVSQ